MEFMDIFEKWAPEYDATVKGENEEYRDVFEHYDEMLNEVADLTQGQVLEIGAGTGNLTQKLIDKGSQVSAIDPSKDMREVAKVSKNINVEDGHFFNIPFENKFDFIVSSFAFHHIRPSEKADALKYLLTHLKDNGKIIILDTMFQDENYKLDLVKHYNKRAYFNLTEDMQTEYYTYVDELQDLIDQLDLKMVVNQRNKFAWLAVISK